MIFLGLYRALKSYRNEFDTLAKQVSEKPRTVHCELVPQMIKRLSVYCILIRVKTKKAVNDNCGSAHQGTSELEIRRQYKNPQLLLDFNGPYCMQTSNLQQHSEVCTLPTPGHQSTTPDVSCFRACVTNYYVQKKLRHRSHTHTHIHHAGACLSIMGSGNQ